MSHNNSYPSPNAAQVGEGAGPFYAAQQTQRIPPQEDLELSVQLSREMAPGSNQGNSDHHDMQRVDQKFSQPIYTQHPMQNYQPQMNVTPQGQSSRAFVSQDNTPLEDSSARKKSKVSRACDECRRKKIRCDAESDAPNHPKCSNCQRTQMTCQFSRQPMKRGPSKGYIKELADRLDQVEKRVTGGGPSPFSAMSPTQTPQQVGNEYGLGPDMGFDRKRTHSMSEGLSGQAYAPPQVSRVPDSFAANGGWQNRDATSQLEQAAQPYAEPKPPAPFADMNYTHTNNNYTAVTNGLMQSTATAHPSTTEAKQQQAKEDEMGRFSLENERLLDEYDENLHTTFPLLANDRNVLRGLINNYPKLLRDALYGALHLMALLCSPTAPPPDVSELRLGKKALEELVNAERHDTCYSRTMEDNLVIMQIALIMCLNIDLSGPRSPQSGEFASKGIWFGIAFTIAKHLQLHRMRLEAPDPRQEPDSFLCRSRRAYWSLVIMDRYHAASTAGTASLPAYATSLMVPYDRHVLGEQFFQLARLSRALIHLTYVFNLTTSVYSGPNAVGDGIRDMAGGELVSYHEQVSDIFISYPLLEAAFWHAHLLHARSLANLTAPSNDPANIFGSVRQLVDILKGANFPVTPFTHHFVALASKTLTELADDRENTKALEVLNDLRQLLEEKRILSSRTGMRTWEKVFLDEVKAKLGTAQMDQANLQHLADAAVGGTEAAADSTAAGGPTGIGEPASRVFDWSELTRKGYLSVYN